MPKHRDIVFLSHGGGPMPLLDEPKHRELVAYWQQVASELPKPDAILIVSAHWESEKVTVTGGADSSLLYDYYGFPAETYNLNYPCPGEPELAKKIVGTMAAQGIDAALDNARGLDHGVFVPLLKMYPEADIPVVEMSLLASLDAAEHWKVGRALQALDYDRLLIIGSGFSFHNMAMFRVDDKQPYEAMNREFQEWLLETCASGALNDTERMRRMLDWEAAPHARFTAPREEHLLPLHVCAAAAGRAADKADLLMAIDLSCCCFQWRC